MKIVNKFLNIITKEKFDFIDITEKTKDFVKTSQIKNGFLNIQTLHTTATIFVNENESLLIEDFKNHLENIAPQTTQIYNHDNLGKRTINICSGECKNGHSHCKALHLPVNITLNLINGEVQLGQWQRILFVELDRGRERKIQLQVMGE